jgi:hypothetical protein
MKQLILILLFPIVGFGQTVVIKQIIHQQYQMCAADPVFFMRNIVIFNILNEEKLNLTLSIPRRFINKFTR